MIEKAKSQEIGREELARKQFRLGKKILELERIERQMQQRIDEVKREYSDRLERRRETIEKLERDLRLACEDSRDRLLTGQKKSVDTLYGRVGWRSQPDRIALQGGVSSNDAAERLENAGHPLVRVRKKPDKSALKEALKDGDITVKTLETCGLEFREGGEDWYYEVDRDSVRDELEDD